MIDWTLLVPMVVASWCALALVLAVLPVIGHPRQFLRECLEELRLLFAVDVPRCPECGRDVKPLGRQADMPWWYCEPCGRMWSDTQLGRTRDEAVAS